MALAKDGQVGLASLSRESPTFADRDVPGHLLILLSNFLGAAGFDSGRYA